MLTEYERRCIIHFLREEEDNRATFTEVVSHLTKQDPTPDDPQRVEVALRHEHLPKLSSIGVLDFDARSETVRYHGDDLINDLMDVTPETHVTVS